MVPSTLNCVIMCEQLMVDRLQGELAGKCEKEREKEGQLAELLHQLQVLREERDELQSSLTSARSALLK